MDATRISELFAEQEKQRIEAQAKREAFESKRQKEEEFRRCWDSVYVNTASASWRQSSIKNLIELGKLIVDRNWDFYLGEMASQSELIFHFEIALIILRHACDQNSQQLASCLANIPEDRIHLISDAHAQLFDACQSTARGAPPCTPPLNQRKMAEVLGISPQTFRGQFRARYWRTKDPDNVHARKWWNTVRSVQMDALRSIRAKFPEKIWLNNRGENENPV